MTTIITDIGQVLVEVNTKPVIDELITCGIAASSIEAQDFLDAVEDFQCCGHINFEQAISLYFGNRASKIHKKRILDAWCSEGENGLIVRYNIELLDYISRYGSKALLASNMGIDHAKIVLPKLRSMNYYFDEFISCFVGTSKPKYLFFKTMADKYDYVVNSDSLYIDDKDDNLQMGAEFIGHCIKYNISTEDSIINIKTSVKFIEDHKYLMAWIDYNDKD